MQRPKSKQRDPIPLARRADRLYHRAWRLEERKESHAAHVWFFWSALYKRAYIGLVHGDTRAYKELRRNLKNPPEPLAV